MKTSLTIAEKIISSILLIIGVLFTCQAIILIYNYHFTDMLKFESYMISMTTLVSNLINGILLIVSSLFFLINKQKGASLYRCTGVMFILYFINLIVLDIVEYGKCHLFFLCMYIVTVFSFGLFLYFWFSKKYLVNSQYNFKKRLLIVLFGVLIYLCIDLIFYDWYPLFVMGKLP